MTTKPKLVTAQDIRDDFDSNNMAAAGAEGYLAQTASAKAAIMQRLNEIHDSVPEDRVMNAEERREYTWCSNEMQRFNVLDADIKAAAAHRTAQMRGVIVPVDTATPYREGLPLASNQTVVGALRATGRVSDQDEDLSFGKYLRGAVTGRWDGADRERQAFNAASGASSAAGGILLPEILSANLIDKARARTRVLQAGARIVPMRNRKVVVPKWAVDPVPTWRGENAPFAEDDGELGSVELNAKGLGVVTKASIELIEDTDIQEELEASFVKSFSQVIDLAALYADGTNDGPTGIKSTAGVNVQALAANGATPTWDALVESVGRVRDANEDPNAQIMSDRTLRSLSLLKESGTGAYVVPPSYLDGVTRYTTGQVPNNLDTGTSVGNTSDVFTADWSQLLVGIRTELKIFLLKERYLADAGQIGFVAHWRGDFAVAREAAFDVVTGVKA